MSKHGPRLDTVKVTHQQRRIRIPIGFDTGISAEFETLSPSFAERYGGGHSRWVNVVVASSYNHKIATVLPRNTFNRSWPNLGLTNDPVPITSEGWIFKQQHKDWMQPLRLLENDAAVIGWLRTQKLAAQLSEPGHIAKQILDSLQGLWGLRLLRDADTIKLLNKMAGAVRKRGTDEGFIEESFAGRTCPLKDWIAHIEKRRQKHFARAKLSEFTERNVIRLGLETVCPHCKFANWHGLDATNYEIRCERCLKSYPFPQANLDKDNQNWKYRVIGPFAVPDYARGAYAALLAIDTLQSLSGPGYEATYSTALELTFENKEKAEIDFALWRRKQVLLNPSDEPDFLVGEAKSFGNQTVKSEDIAKLKKISAHLPSATIVIAVMKESFSEEERELLKRFVSWSRKPNKDGRPRTLVILLTGTELFSGYSVKEAWEKAGGRFRAFADYSHFETIQSFAFATQSLYADMPPYDYWRTKKKRGELKRKTSSPET